VPIGDKTQFSLEKAIAIVEGLCHHEVVSGGPMGPKVVKTLPEGVENTAEALELAGFVRGSADAKGRVKCPVAIRKHFEKTGETMFFVTTFNLKTIRIYTVEKWKENLALMDGSPSKGAKSILRIAKAYGNPASIDRQGRILLSTELRRKLGVGEEEVYFEKSQDHIAVHTKQVYDALLAEAEEDLDDKLQEVEELGVR
jgi:DNA-binding transcriptional regulator/RsmH inhibitor MraZ